MTRPHKARATGRHDPIQSTSDSGSDPLDAIVNEAMERFVRVLVRRGASQRCIQRAFRQHGCGCREMPRRIGVAPRAS